MSSGRVGQSNLLCIVIWFCVNLCPNQIGKVDSNPHPLCGLVAGCVQATCVHATCVLNIMYMYSTYSDYLGLGLAVDTTALLWKKDHLNFHARYAMFTTEVHV